MDIGDFLRSALGSPFAAGAAGGLVRSFYVKEAYGIALMRTIAGGISAHYITPIILWTAPRFIEMTQAELLEFSSPASAAVAFGVGLLGIFVSTTVEKIINKRFKIDDEG